MGVMRVMSSRSTGTLSSAKYGFMIKGLQIRRHAMASRTLIRNQMFCPSQARRVSHNGYYEVIINGFRRKKGES